MTIHLERSDAAPIGMTLVEYAAARHLHPQAVRSEYSQMMRDGKGITLPVITRHEHCDGVTKFGLPVSGDGGAQLETESVIIPMNGYRGTNWHTLCVSSQIGCRMGCTFCETGRMGLLRNLSAADIVRQRLVARHLLLDHTADPSRRFRYFSDGVQNIVFMGMGEPLDNFDNVVQAIRVLNDPAGLNFPLSQITVSTVGRVEGLQNLATLARTEPARGWGTLRLAISLNAPNDTLRDQLMPINKSTPLAALQRTLREYPLPRKGLYLIQYVLIKDVNDSRAHADAVAAWCRPLPCVVNVIPYNPQRDASYETPSESVILAFMMRLKEQGIFVKRRVTHGRDLMGACGQLGNPELRAAARAARLTRASPPLRSRRATAAAPEPR